MIKNNLLYWLVIIGILSACGKLEWPPKSNFTSYSGQAKSLDNDFSRARQTSLKLAPSTTSKKFPASIIREKAKEHIVAGGETLWRIAQAYNTDIYELAIINQIEPPFRIFVGQSLILSKLPGKPVKLAAFRRTQNINKEEFGPPSYSNKMSHENINQGIEKLDDKLIFLDINPGTKPQIKTGRKFESNQQTFSKRKSKKLFRTNLPPVRKGSLFIWPVEGTLISNFGAKGKGLHNDGVNIMAPKGTVVRSAGAGVVAYAGNELRGFGNLLLIKHNNGWVTAYAHNQDLNVRRGEKVRRGQVVGRVGNSGNVFRPQLHFEIRKGNKAVDPILKISNINRRGKNSRRRVSKS